MITPTLPCLVTLLAAVAAPATRAQERDATLPREYRITDLGALGADTNQPWSVNSFGQVAGYSRLTDGKGNYHLEGFFHDGAAIHYVGTPAGAPLSVMAGVNDLGESVGYTGGASGEAILRRADGSIQRLGTLGGSRSAALAIDGRSRIVGWSKVAGDQETLPLVWENGAMRGLPLLGGKHGSATWINDRGQIVGSSTTDFDGLQQFAVLWDRGEVLRLPPHFPGLNNIANHIHDNGDIAGSVSFPRGRSYVTRAATWRAGQVQRVYGTLADGTPAEPFATSWASAVNASGVVVGMSVNAASRLVPFVAVRGSMVQLDDLMPAPWVAVFVGSGAINDAGQIVVNAYDPGGTDHALLLTPR